MIARLGLAGAAAWIGYAWLPHLALPLCVRRGPQEAGRRIALTFDDGPDPDWTPRVLDALAARDVPATFFLVGDRAMRAVGTAREIAARGHDVGSHGWSHRSLWLCGPRRTANDIDRAQAALADLTGAAPRFFRPPWGMVNAAMFPILRTRGLQPVFWSIQPEGLRPTPAAVQVTYVMERAHPGAIVDLHDAEGTPGAPSRLLTALPAMIDGLRAAGYTLTTVSELIRPR